MLMRFDPFRELDRVTQQALGAARTPAMPMDAYRHGDRFVVDLDLPGVDASTVDLTIEKNVLTITAERRFERADGVELVVAERPQGRFSRQLFLGDGLDPDRVEARYDGGVLTVSIPVAETAKPRKVAVTTGGEHGRTIEASSASAGEIRSEPGVDRADDRELVGANGAA